MIFKKYFYDSQQKNRLAELAGNLEISQIPLAYWIIFPHGIAMANPLNKKAKEIPRAKRGRPREFDRQKALLAALEVFWEVGYERATMKQLTAAMGIASPSIYCAFGNKCDLFLEALGFYRQKYWEPEFARFSKDPDFYQGLTRLFSAAPEILLTPDAPCGCLTVITAVNLSEKEKRIRDTINEMRDSTREVFACRIKNAVRDGQLAPDTDVNLLACALKNYFEGLALQARSDLTLPELRRMALAGIELLLGRKTDSSRKE